MDKTDVAIKKLNNGIIIAVALFLRFMAPHSDLGWEEDVMMAEYLLYG